MRKAVTSPKATISRAHIPTVWDTDGLLFLSGQTLD
jgi:hypothetical protein